MKFINGNKRRLFVNTSLGCSSSCSYCYLPNLDIPIGTSETIQEEVSIILEEIIESKDFIAGKHGTIISIGCYSECWNQFNKEKTKILVESLLRYGNPIQIASKKFIKLSECSFVQMSRAWRDQLSVFISCSTISQWEKYEKGTSPPQERFQSFCLTKELGIPTCLYIKPVIPNVTLTDKEKFAMIMHKFDISCVVGRRFSVRRSDDIAPIGNDRLFYTKETDEPKLMEYLRNFGKVHEFSTDFVEERRNIC